MMETGVSQDVLTLDLEMEPNFGDGFEHVLTNFECLVSGAEQHLREAVSHWSQVEGGAVMGTAISALPR